jgi:hypothetical protein
VTASRLYHKVRYVIWLDGPGGRPSHIELASVSCVLRCAVPRPYGPLPSDLPQNVRVFRLGPRPMAGAGATNEKAGRAYT